jgi:hypothetical protein
VNIAEGTVVVVDTGEAGTVIEHLQGIVTVLLANGNLWRGGNTRVHEPTSPEELSNAIYEVDRFHHREKKKHPKKRSSYLDEFETYR